MHFKQELKGASITAPADKYQVTALSDQVDRFPKS